jgi:tetratricopeptide (TPR) repeat protein
MPSRYFEFGESRTTRSAAGDARRVALLIGVGAYPGSPLFNPARDVALVGRALTGVGFQVETVVDPTKAAFETAIVRFAERLERAGSEAVGFFYFAGHGIQHLGSNYMVPLDAQIPEPRYLRSGAVPVDYLAGELASATAQATVIVVDTCRDNSLPASGGGLTQGLGSVAHLPDGSILVFSTAAGEVADDGDSGNSPYAIALARQLAVPGRRLDEIFLSVAADVAEATASRQRPAVFLQGAMPSIVLNPLPADPGAAPPVAGLRPPPMAVSAQRLSIGPKASRIFANVPPRDLNFTGRDGDLARLHALVDGPGRLDGARQVVIHGLGGMGKSSLASEYAYRHADHFAAVWWAPAEQRQLLVDSLAQFAVGLEPGLAGEPDREKAAAAGFKLVSRFDAPVLFVYDNVESPETVRGLAPPPGARLIMTTRWADWGGLATPLGLEVFEPAAAADFLAKRAGRDDPAGAARLAAALGHLPLALDHAGAFCRLTATRFDAYRDRVDDRVSRAPKGVAYPASIAATFGLAIEKAALEHPAAETLLGHCALLSPDGIPLALFTDAFMAEDDRAEAFAALYVVSLIEHGSLPDGAPAISLHRLVQAAMRVRLAESGRLAATADAVIAQLTDAFPDRGDVDPSLWPQCSALLPHVLAVLAAAAGGREASSSLGELLQRAGRFLYGRGSYAEAEPLLRRAVAIGEQTWPRDHPALARRLNDLALLLATSGRYSEAEPLLREVIASGESELGRRNPDVAERLNNLARLLNNTGRRTEAEPLYREAIAIADDVPGADPVSRVAWRNNLAILLNEAGRNDEAEPLYREAIAIGEQLLGHQHHEVARCFNNLGRVLLRTGRLDEAEAVARESLDISRASLGPEHPIYARQQHSLAQILAEAGRGAEALEEARAALAIHERTLDIGHAWTRDSALTCVEILRAEARPDEAEAIGQRFAFSRT